MQTDCTKGLDRSLYKVINLKYMAEEKSGYGKRPLWQWILIYLVVGGIVYGVIYFFLAGQGVSSPY